MKKTALFAGSFDPLTNGHIDTISRAAIVFDEIVVAVSTNTSKQSLFDGEERIRLVAEALRDFPQVRVVRFLLDYVSRHGYALFGWWRIAVGGVSLIALLMLG